MAFSRPIYLTIDKATETTSSSGVTSQVLTNNPIRIGAKRISAPTQSFNTSGERNQRVTTVKIEINKTPYTRTLTLDDKITMGGDQYTILDIDDVTRQPVALILTLERVHA